MFPFELDFALVLTLGLVWVSSGWESSSVGLTASLNRQLVVLVLGGSERV